MSKYYYHTRNIGGDICYYKKRKDDEFWQFTTKDDYEINKIMEKGGGLGNKIDMNIPLFIRMLEFAKEDAKTDMDLHRATENAIALLKSKKELTMEDYNSIVDVRKKLYRGGEIENYNKWKSIDWGSFKFNRNIRSNIYRFLGWVDSERIDWTKMPEQDKEWFYEEFIYQLEDEDTLEYIFADPIKEIEDDFESLMDEELDDKDLKNKKTIDAATDKLLLTDEYKGLREGMNKYELTRKDLETKSTDELLKEVYAGKDKQWVIDYFILKDENWLDFKYVFNNDYESDLILNKMYNYALENGAVFTEEEESQQFDMFAEVPAEIKKEKEKVAELDENKLVQEINSELSMLNELLDDAKEDSNKELISELEDRIEFLEELRDDALPYENGGVLKDFNKIMVNFNTNYTPVRLDFYASSITKPLHRIGGANSELYLDSTKVLNLKEIILDSEYNNPKDVEVIVSLIKRDLEKETGKTQLMIKKSIQ